MTKWSSQNNIIYVNNEIDVVPIFVEGKERRIGDGISETAFKKVVTEFIIPCSQGLF